MAHADSNGTDRRGFLQAAAGAAAVLGATAAPAHSQEKAAPAKVEALPRRKLGKTGAQVTMLNQGAVKSEALDRIFRTAFASGIRMFDTARAYGSEPSFRKWFEQDPAVRKEIFLVTKDEPKEPGQLVGMLDQRLETLGTDQVDLFFVHGLGDHHTTDEAIRFLKSPDFARAADAMRKSGKARFVGFSAHHKDRAEMIKVAAQTGVVDAIMLMYSPWLEKDSELNKALDLAYEKGIGLISMKQTAGKFLGDKPKTNIFDEVKARVPALAERNLTPFQGLLHAIWTDERISSVCVSMRNTEQIRENSDAAKRYEPLKAADIRALGEAVVAHSPTLCADCDGRCSVAAGTKAALGDLARFYTYHEHHGDRIEARRQYAALAAEARDWSGADLVAAREACHLKIDFSTLLAEVDRLLA
jgi:aryl-alcohol dehydrogenase-like predicted oxidoreductase